MVKGGFHKLIGALLVVVLLVLPNTSLAVGKSVSLTVSKDGQIATDDIIEVAIKIDTDGEKVGVIGFDIEFSTEVLSGRTPDQAGSEFPVCAVLTSTRYDCGKPGQGGFSGTGLITTLAFEGRAVGTSQVTIKNFEAHYGPTGAEVAGFTIDSEVTVSVKKSVASPTATPTRLKPLPTGTNSVINRRPANYTDKPSKITKSGKSYGSKQSVTGEKGAKKEEPIKKAEAAPQVKGALNKNTGMLSFIPTLLLLMLVVWLAFKLYFTDKRRHLEINNLLESQLGALSTLENKLDLVEQKGAIGKETVIKEIEEAKNELINEVGKPSSNQPQDEKK